MSFLKKYIPVFLFIFGGILGIFLYVIYEESFIKKWEENNEIFSSSKIESVQNIIKDEYYHFSEKTKEEIENGMITALVESLGDKHSSYFAPKEAREFAEVLRWDFEGIGAVIDEHIRGIIIRKVFDDSPAKKSWLQSGDIILKVGTDSMLGMTAEEAVKKIRWPKWSKAQILYSRWEDNKESSIEVTRSTIIIPSTQERMLTGTLGDIGYVEVAFFGEKTPDEFAKSLQNITASGAKAVILDFRNNGGGYVDAAVDILWLLLPDDSLAVTTRENEPKNTLTLRTKESLRTNTDIPIVMLINNLSASATEIVAWALQDYERAIIIGEKSYGKGSVQLPFVLKDGSILKLTIGRWYTPKDQNIDKNGIRPDISIPLFERDFEKRYDRQLEYSKDVIKMMLEWTLKRGEIIQKMKLQDFTK